MAHILKPPARRDAVPLARHGISGARGRVPSLLWWNRLMPPSFTTRNAPTQPAVTTYYNRLCFPRRDNVSQVEPGGDRTRPVGPGLSATISRRYALGEGLARGYLFKIRKVINESLIRIHRAPAPTSHIPTRQFTKSILWQIDHFPIRSSK